MNTLFQVNEAVPFENTQEYREKHLQSFLKVLGITLSRRSDIKDSMSIGDLIEVDEGFSTEFFYLLRFTVVLLEEKEIDAIHLDAYDVYEILDRRLPEDFISDIADLVMPLDIAELIEKAVPMQQKSSLSEDEALIKHSIISTLSVLLQHLESVPDELTIDALLETPEITAFVREHFQYATYITRHFNDESFEIDEETLKSTTIDEQQYQNVMFEVGTLTKRALIDAALTAKKQLEGSLLSLEG